MIRPIAMIAAGLVIATPASACRCRAPTPAQAYAAADAVVLGTVMNVRDVDAVRTVFSVAVERSWKRQQETTLNVDTATTCRLPVRPGDRYLLYLRRDAARRYYTTHCMGDVIDPGAGEIDAVSRLAGAPQR